jgi:hypothetical protein
MTNPPNKLSIPWAVANDLALARVLLRKAWQILDSQGLSVGRSALLENVSKDGLAKSH